MSEDTTEDFEGQEDEQNEIRAAFDVSVSDSSEEDDVKMAMIGAGATFKNVTRFYNQFMIDAGLAISKADRDQIVADTLEGLDLETEEDFELAVGNLTAAVQGATERSAAALIRSYGKKNELPVYSKPKGEGSGRVGFASQFYDFLVANPTVSEDAAKAYVMGEGENADTSENVKRHISHYMGIWGLANRIVASYGLKAA
jgi:hypothetical protein